ncbi:MAG: hypothetical protein PHH30_06620 [Bacteroidales bacterium]|nr:hypothetical protein [Bacteroidales bacterium]MDD3858913.1 hypothetical protein [Bacteroidales bacterium]
MKKILCLLSLLTFTLVILGQDVKTSKIRISDLCISNGIKGDYNIPSDLSDFLKLAPSSDLLKNDFTGFGKSEFYTGVSTNDNIFNISLGLLFYDKLNQTYKSNPQLNIGITFISASTLSAYYSKYQNIRYDTLTSDNSTNMVFLDTIINQTYQMNYLFQQIGINANLIFRTQPAARWSLYSGIGISATASLMSATHIYHSDSKYLAYIFSDNSTYYNYNFSNRNNYSEVHPNKTNISFYTYLPLGLDFRIAKKNEFWRKIHLVLEMQPGLAIDNIPELGTKTYGSMRGSFGLRVEM